MAKKVHEIISAKITAISLVRKGANRRKFQILKSDGAFAVPVTFTKSAAAKQIAYGEVYVPNSPDTQGDYASAEMVRKMAHDFVAAGRVGNIDVEHDELPSGCSVVESFVARKGDPDFTEGAWVVGVHIPDADLWAQVVSGAITGLSMFGDGERVEREATDLKKSAEPEMEDLSWLLNSRRSWIRF